LSLFDPTNVFSSKPLVGMPAWWRAFLFQTLNGRQLSVYLYLVMLMGDGAVCSPTIDEIAKALGLMSTTMVFDALNVLESHGFILRSRTAATNPRSRRNVYQRPSCEYTILRLLEAGHIDGTLHGKEASSLAPRCEFDDGLRSLLGDRYALYAIAPAEQKRDALVSVLREIIDEAQVLSA